MVLITSIAEGLEEEGVTTHTDNYKFSLIIASSWDYSITHHEGALTRSAGIANSVRVRRLRLKQWLCCVGADALADCLWLCCAVADCLCVVQELMHELTVKENLHSLTAAERLNIMTRRSIAWGTTL